MSLSRAQGSIAATVKAKGQAPVQCNLLCIVCYGTNGGFIVLDLMGEQMLGPMKTQRFFLTPANGSVQRLNGSLFSIEANQRGANQVATNITFTPDESSELYGALCSVLEIWPMQRRVGRLLMRYTAKVASLTRHARPSRANSLLSHGTTANGSPRFTAPVLSQLQEPGAAQPSTANPLLAPSSTYCSPFDGRARFVRVPRMPAGQGRVLPGRRGRSAEPLLHRKATSDDDADVMNFCEAVVDMMQKSGTIPVALGGTGSRMPAGSGAGTGGKPLTDRAAAALKQFLPLFAPVMYKYETLSMTLLRGPAAAALFSPHAAVAPAASPPGGVGAAYAQEADPYEGFFRARMKELLKLVSYLSEAASCTVTGRNGLSRKAHRRVMHNSRHSVAVQIGLKAGGKKTEAADAPVEQAESKPAPHAPQVPSLTIQATCRSAPPEQPAQGEVKMVASVVKPGPQAVKIEQVDKPVVLTTQRSVIVPGAQQAPAGPQQLYKPVTTTARSWLPRGHAASSVAQTSTVADGAESVSANGGGNGSVARQSVGPVLDMSQAGAFMPSQTPTPMHQLAHSALPFYPRNVAPPSSPAWNNGMQLVQPAQHAAWFGGVAQHQQPWMSAPVPTPTGTHTGYIPYAVPPGMQATPMLMGSLPMKGMQQDYVLQSPRAMHMAHQVPTPVHNMNMQVPPSPLAMHHGGMPVMYMPMRVPVQGSTGYPVMLAPNGHAYVGMPAGMGMHGMV